MVLICSQVTVRPSIPGAYQCKITQSTGIATQMQLQILWRGNRDMSTDLEYKERETQRKRESGRQASEAQQEKERKRARASDKNKGDEFRWMNKTKILYRQ